MMLVASAQCPMERVARVLPAGNGPTEMPNEKAFI